MTWSLQQDGALRGIRYWHEHRNGLVFRLFGYAGTGKRHVAAEVGHMFRGVHFAAFTGKAANVLKEAGGTPASTLHRLLYRIEGDEYCRRFVLRQHHELSEIRLIVVDECSMIDAHLAEDLLSFRIPVLAIGDLFQLPPITAENGFFMHAKPNAMLDQIHRQARDNPILRLANDVRAGSSLPPVGYGDDRVCVVNVLDESSAAAAWLPVRK